MGAPSAQTPERAVKAASLLRWFKVSPSARLQEEAGELAPSHGLRKPLAFVVALVALVVFGASGTADAAAARGAESRIGEPMDDPRCAIGCSWWPHDGWEYGAELEEPAESACTGGVRSSACTASERRVAVAGGFAEAQTFGESPAERVRWTERLYRSGDVGTLRFARASVFDGAIAEDARVDGTNVPVRAAATWQRIDCVLGERFAPGAPCGGA